jgi:osmotically-inducible protein OsmY
MKHRWVIMFGGICLLTPVVTFGAGYLPYGEMAKAAASDESIPSQARSAVIKTEWKTGLVAAEGLKGVQLKPFVLMQRGFVVGLVNSEDQRNEVEKISKSLPLRSLDCYLPVHKKNSRTSESALQFGGAESRTPAFLIKMQIKAALVQYGLRAPLNVDVVVLNDTAVLIGIVDNEQERSAILETAERTKSIHHVVNFLLLPEPGYEKLLPPLIP